jgi:hypothetical protein
MHTQTSQRSLPRHSPSASHQVHLSPALEWIWKFLSDVRHPRILDCGPVANATVDVLLRRGVKIHVADLVTPLLHDEARFWDRRGKVAVFRTGEFLTQFPCISPESVAAIFGWHLLDLLPREAHQPLVERWRSFLAPGGVLFCLLREPRLEKGSEMLWWLESLTTLGSSREGVRPFPCAALTNREMERLAPTASVKTFLTRSGRREVVAIFQNEGSYGPSRGES